MMWSLARRKTTARPGTEGTRRTGRRTPLSAERLEERLALSSASGLVHAAALSHRTQPAALFGHPHATGHAGNVRGHAPGASSRRGPTVRAATSGGTGYVLGMKGWANAVVIQPIDGKIVAAGLSDSNSQAALARYNPDGTLDPSFGSGGQVTTALDGHNGQFDAEALAADGKIVATGEVFKTVQVKGVATSYAEFAVARFNANGTLDTTFGGTKNKNGTITNAGEVVVPFGNGRAVATGIGYETVNGSTKIVVAGWTNAINGHPEIVVMRLNSDGTFDTSFGGGKGRVITAVPGFYTLSEAMAIQADGKIVVTGLASNTNYSFLARYNVDGTLDTSFGSNGVVFANPTLGDQIFAMAIQPDGKIVLAGQGVTDVNGVQDGRGEIARFNPDGSVDTSFGGGTGVALYPDAVDGSWHFAVALQSDGKIVAAGQGPNFTLMVDRFNSDGSLDATYGTGGVSTFSLGAAPQYNAVAIQPSDGEVVAVGYSPEWNNRNFLISRYTTDGQLDTSF